MATVDENFLAFLKADSTIARLVGARIHENQVPQNPTGDYIWFALAGEEDEYCLDDADGAAPFRFRYAVECVGYSSSDKTYGLRKSREMANAVKSRVKNYNGSFGDSTVQGLFVDEVSEDYEPRNDFSDLGFHTRSIAVEVIP